MTILWCVFHLEVCECVQLCSTKMCFEGMSANIVLKEFVRTLVWERKVINTVLKEKEFVGNCSKKAGLGLW